MEFKELQEKVLEWANKRDLIKGGSRDKQLKKCYEEFGELCRADIKNDRKEIIDSIGDMLVCFINYAEITDAGFYDDKDIETNKVISDTYGVYGDLIINIGRHLGDLSQINAHIDTTTASKDCIKREVSHFILKVVLSIKRYAESQDLDIVECLEAAYNDIKDRKGKTVDGVFIKDEKQKGESIEIRLKRSAGIE